MTAYLRIAFKMALVAMFAVTPANAVAAISTFVIADPHEPPTGLVDPANPRVHAPRVHEAFPWRTSRPVLPVPLTIDRQRTEPIVDHVPRHVRHCVWRE